MNGNYHESQGATEERPRAMSGSASIAINESQGATEERPRVTSGFAGVTTKNHRKTIILLAKGANNG